MASMLISTKSVLYLCLDHLAHNLDALLLGSHRKETCSNAMTCAMQEKGVAIRKTKYCVSCAVQLAAIVAQLTFSLMRANVQA
jgi:hypothetical protein